MLLIDYFLKSCVYCYFLVKMYRGKKKMRLFNIAVSNPEYTSQIILKIQNIYIYNPHISYDTYN